METSTLNILICCVTLSIAFIGNRANFRKRVIGLIEREREATYYKEWTFNRNYAVEIPEDQKTIVRAGYDLILDKLKLQYFG
jgi:hypothetical protein